jgi:opacity protein-like surface antigen
MRKFIAGAVIVLAALPVGAAAAHAAPVPERGQTWAAGQTWASQSVAERGQTWAATTSPSPFYSGAYRPSYGTGPVMPPKYFDRDRNGNTRDAKTNGLSDMPPSNVNPRIVCFRVGGGFCWLPWIW